MVPADPPELSDRGGEKPPVETGDEGPAPVGQCPERGLLPGLSRRRGGSPQAPDGGAERLPRRLVTGAAFRAPAVHAPCGILFLVSRRRCQRRRGGPVGLREDRERTAREGTLEHRVLRLALIGGASDDRKSTVRSRGRKVSVTARTEGVVACTGGAHGRRA